MKTWVLSIIFTVVSGSGVFSQESSLSQFLVVPNRLANVQGNIGISGPFLPYKSVITGEYDPSRFQQVYSANEFISLIPSGGWISGISFRGYGPPGIGVNLPDIQINFSTTGRTPDGLSVVYADNVGTDDAVVFGRGPLNSFTIVPGTVFTGNIVFASPFFYDPIAGNLLMDVRTYAGISLPVLPPIPTMDAQSTIGDSVSAMGGALSNSSGSSSTIGLVSQFLITPVPEPSSVVILSLSALGLSFTAWRQSIKSRS